MDFIIMHLDAVVFKENINIRDILKVKNILVFFFTLRICTSCKAFFEITCYCLSVSTSITWTMSDIYEMYLVCCFMYIKGMTVLLLIESVSMRLYLPLHV